MTIRTLVFVQRERADGGLTLLVVNKSANTAFNTNISVSGTSLGSTGTLYSYGIPQDNAAETGVGSADIATSPITGLSTNFSYNFPAYSANVIAFGSGEFVFTHAQRYKDCYSNGHPDGYSDRNRHRHANGFTDTYLDPDGDTYRYEYSTTTATATTGPTQTATPTSTPTTTMSVTASLAFGNVALGQTLTKTVTVDNTGTTHSLVIGSATSSDPAEYALSGTGTCGAIPITVAPRTTCTLGITFIPGALGAHGATLMIFDNVSTSPQHVTLSGTGIAGLTLTKTSLVFGSVKFGVKAPLSFSLTNHQTRTVTLSESFSGINASDFSVTGGTCSTTLNAGKACTLTVTFKPGALGTESATLSIADSPDPLSPYTVALSTGPTIPATVTPASIAYGTLTNNLEDLERDGH